MFFGFLSCSADLRKSAHITGLSVKATMVDIITDTAMVRVNCLYSIPVIPERKLTGTNTAHNTNDMAMRALPISCMAFLDACAGESPSLRIILSTFSTTTIASSTTVPIARTIPNKVSVLRLNPNTSITPNVPISDMGTAIAGMSVARQL